MDSLFYLPFRYEDRKNLSRICDMAGGRPETIQGKILTSHIRGGKRFRLFEIAVNDGTGLMKAKWFNQPFLKKNLCVGQEVVLSGIAGRDPRSGALEMDNPEYELVTSGTDSLIHTNRIVPFYRLTEGISQKQFRKTMFGIVESHASDIPDPIPPEIISKNNLPPLSVSIRQVHFPEDGSLFEDLNRGASPYHKRLSFDEFFMFGLGTALMKKNGMRKKGICFDCEGRLRKALLGSLPFELTEAQKRVLADILKDMEKPHPMNRLLQGDVGSGKTVVALISMLNAVECGFQTVLMAPTEILAEQHFFTIRHMTEGLGLNLKLLTGSSKEKELDLLAAGKTDIAVGTHAVIQEGVVFGRLGLAVIDEQHRFGVMQRSLLRKKGMNPDVLVMTATPIPRSLALTLYGDLDYSVIDELPPGRSPVITKVFDPGQKEAIYRIIGDEIKRGRQVYVVYPVIEESSASDISTRAALKSAVQGEEAFQRIFPEFRTGLIHGKMSPEERGAVMASFKEGRTDILVSTTVIEVGVDVPNATVMLIIHAERFGLAQLHQLRGRVGRGAERSYCLLVAYGQPGEDAKRRLDIMVRSGDGFRIAEEDLEIRGPGEFFGTRQAGIPDFRVADMVRDIRVLEAAKEEAFNLIEASPELEEFPSLKKSLEVFWKGKKELFKTG